MAENIVYNLLDGFLPVTFVFSDALLYYFGITSKYTNLIIAVLKLAVTLAVTGYVSYLYFYKKQTHRTTSNVLDLTLYGIIIVILIVVISLISVKVHTERTQKVEEETQ